MRDIAALVDNDENDPERKKSVRRSAPTYAFGQHH